MGPNNSDELQQALSNLLQCRKIVSLEAFSVPNVGVRDLIARVLPSISESFTDVVGFFSSKEKPIDVPKPFRKFATDISKHSYADLLPLAAYQPEGLSVSYLEYINILLEVVRYTSAVETRVNTYHTYLSGIISESSLRVDTTNNVVIYKEMEKQRADFNARLGECFANGSTRSESSYGDLIKRNSDWGLVLTNMDSLVKDMNEINRSDLNKKASVIADLLRRVKRLLEGGELDNAAAEVAVELAEGGYQIAREMEFFAIIYYRVAALSGCINHTVDHVSKALELK